MSRPVVVSPVKAILAMRELEARGLPASRPKTVDDVENAGGKQVADQFEPDEDGERRLLGRFEDDAVAGGEGRGELPDGHQDGEIPGDDLADDAEGFVIVIGDGGGIDFGDAAFLGADGSGEVAEMVDGERDVGRHGFADRLAVVPGFDGGKELKILLHALGDLFEDAGAGGNGSFAPLAAAAWAASRARSISAALERGISHRTLPVMGVTFRSSFAREGASTRRLRSFHSVS